MGDLIVDFITSLDGYGAAEGWPGWWGLEGPEYLGWLAEQPNATLLMGANTYRLMSGFAAGTTPQGIDEFSADEDATFNGLTAAAKVVFSSTLEGPLAWANTTLVRDDAVKAVRAMKADRPELLSTIGSISLCRSLLRAGVVDRFRVVIFPVITGATGSNTHRSTPKPDEHPNRRTPQCGGCCRRRSGRDRAWSAMKSFERDYKCWLFLAPEPKMRLSAARLMTEIGTGADNGSCSYFPTYSIVTPTTPWVLGAASERGNVSDPTPA